MDVNFNNLRRQAMISYDNVCTKLNRTIDNEGYITIKASDIQKDMDLLRQHIGIIACVFEKDNEDFKVVRDEVVMAEFNPNGETD